MRKRARAFSVGSGTPWKVTGGTDLSVVYCEGGWIETVSWSLIRESLAVA